jgi:hypothetical protein
MPRVLPIALTIPLALFAAACSDPPPTPAAAGVSISLSPASVKDVPNLGSRSCTAGDSSGFTYALGQPNSGRTIEDGKSGVHVTCTVTAAGSFNLNASGVDGNGHKPVSFTFTGAIKDKVNTAANLGGMTFFSPDTSQLVTLGGDYPGCTYGPVTTLKKGAILTDINCPLIGGSDDTTSGCKVHGTVAFEYCLTGEEQN